MMYRNSRPRMQLSNADLRLQRRVLLIACAVLLTAAVVLGALYVPSKSYHNQVQVQIRQRMYSTCSSAIDEVNRLGSIVTSSASSRICPTQVRQASMLSVSVKVKSCPNMSGRNRMAESREDSGA